MKAKTILALALASTSLLLLSDDLDTDQVTRIRSVKKVLVTHPFFDAATGELIQVNSELSQATYEITDTSTNLVSVTRYPGNATRPAGDTKTKAGGDPPGGPAASRGGHRRSGVGHRCQAVDRLIGDLGLAEKPRLVVFNECDRLDGSEADRLERLYPGSVAVSALLGEGLDRLAGEMAARLGLKTRRVTLEFDVGSERERARLARAMRLGHVVGRRDTDERVRIELDLPRRMLAEFLPSSSHAS